MKSEPKVGEAVLIPSGESYIEGVIEDFYTAPDGTVYAVVALGPVRRPTRDLPDLDDPGVTTITFPARELKVSA